MKEENSGQNAPVPEAVTGSTSGSSADGIMPHLAVTVEDSKQNLTAKTSADKEKRTRKYLSKHAKWEKLLASL